MQGQIAASGGEHARSHERSNWDGIRGGRFVWRRYHPGRNCRTAAAPRECLADMEGPAVKWFVAASSISRSMLPSAQCARERGGIPEDADARLTMERLRRRIRLICAGCSEEQSRMTPLRRELPPSRGASRPDPKTGRRIASARTLQSCSHRAVVDAARESRSHLPSTSAAHLSHNSYAAELRLSGRVMTAQMNPTSSRAIAATATGVRLPWPTR
jgi:hypothetical protein